jgi:hypothetical protein
MSPMNLKTSWKITTSAGSKLPYHDRNAYEMAQKLRNIWENTFPCNGIKATSEMGVSVSIDASGTLTMKHR